MKKIRKCIALLLAVLLLVMSGCGSQETDTSDGQAADGTDSADSLASDEAAVIDTSDMFSDRDYETDYEDEDYVLITLSGTDAQCESSAVTVSDGMVTITEAGTYVVSGTLTDGTICVDAGDGDKVWLVLAGVSITSEDFAAIYVISADKVFLTLADGTENTLANGGSFEAVDDNNVDAVIFAKDDLTINGSGSLAVSSPAGHGIVCKDDLKITGGVYEITAGAGHALSANDSVRIAAGTFVLESSKDGIQAENDEDEEEGYVYICGGTFTIESEGDGISASGDCTILAGTIQITAGGGSESADDDEFVGQMQQRILEYGSSSRSSEDSSSCKGIKAAGLLTISGGTITVDSADDSLHSNSDILIDGGTITLCSGDDGVHADETLTVEDGTIDITDSYEGLEGMQIYISGGQISIVASDDGINAGGGTDSSGTGGWRQDDVFGSSSSSDLTVDISGGIIYIDADGDGIDSNGSLYISGGQTYVSGPTSSADGALDYTTTGSITGGILVAAGASGMAMNMSTGTQGCVMVTTGSQSACTISLSDASGNELVSYTVEKSFGSVVISCPDMESGETYTLTLGSSSTEITLSNTISSVSLSSGASGGSGGMGGGNMRR